MNSRADSLLSLMGSKGLRLSLAESCTGGLIGAEVTSCPGASLVFMGSAVTYSNEAKEDILGVKHDTLLAHGAVSAETAAEMASGSLRIYRSDIAASVTGIAGPDGGTAEKPVGTVWMAVTDGIIIRTFENHFQGTRNDVREQTVRVLISHLIDFVGEME